MSQSQRLSIAAYFIASSPTGEVDEVVSDVQNLINDDTLSADALLAILRDYNHEQLTAVLEPVSGKPVIVSKFASLGSDVYWDPERNRALHFDHIKRVWGSEVQGVTPPVLSPQHQEVREAVAEAAQKYLSESFKPNKSVSAVYVNADTNVLTLVISAKNVNLGNFWTGSWRSHYQLALGNGHGHGDGALTGAVRAHVHYFEDGNVQLNSNTALDTAVPVDTTDARSTAKRAVDAIARFESEYQNDLEEMYVNMHRTTFKAMRRIMPINRQKFLWSTNAHALAQEVNK